MLDFASSPMNSNVAACFEEIAATHATEWALRTSQGCWRYGELNRRANQIAHMLIQACGQNQGRVAIYCDTLTWQVAAILGGIKSGKTIVPLDTTLPAKRLCQILADAQAEALLVDSQCVAASGTLSAGSAAQSLKTIQIDLRPDDYNDENLAQPIAGSDPLVFMYTSGSTGTPKGVIITHQAELHCAWSKNQIIPLGPKPRAALLSSLSYSAGWGMLFRLILFGGCLCDYSLQRQGLSPLAPWLNSEEITLLMPPITLLRQWYHILETPVHLPNLRYLDLVGAPAGKSDLVQIRNKIMGDYTIILRYGSTEALNIACYAVDSIDALSDGPLPVGHPYPDRQVLLIDEKGRPVSAGEVGEVVVKSPYMSPGYWQNPLLTQAKFATDPQNPTLISYTTGDLGRQDSDGCLYILGRKDSMVKIRGYRVEPTEVERALYTLPTVVGAAVVAHDRPAANQQDMAEKELVAYLVFAPGQEVPLTHLREQLAAILPTYMIPAHFVTVEALPLTPTGKVDRKALPRPEEIQHRSRASVVAPRTATEQELAALWTALLRVEPIGVHDDFFALGGHSLHVLALFGQITQQYQRAVPLHSFFEKPTIAHLATLLATSPVTTPATGSTAHAQSDAESNPDITPPPTVTNTQPPTWEPALAELYAGLGHAGVDQWSTYQKRTQRRMRGRRWLLVHRALQAVPSQLLLPLLARLVRQPSMQKQLFGHQVELIQRFCAVLETAVDEREIITKSLFYGWMHHYQVASRRRARGVDTSPANTAGLCDSLMQQGQGVLLLNSHTVLQPWLPPQSSPQSLAHYMIGHVQNALPMTDPNYQQVTALLLTRQLITAEQLLRQGKIVQIAGDGHQGTSQGIAYCFHGRARRFFTGFAELAVRTEVPVVPLIHGLSTTGDVHYTLGEKFDVAEKNLSPEQRIEHLLSLYVALLHEQWASMPWLIPWYQMERHLAYPESSVAHGRVEPLSYSAVGLKTVGFPLAGTTLFKQSPL